MLHWGCVLVLWVGVCCKSCIGAPGDKNRLANLKNSTDIATQFLTDIETRGTNLTAYQVEAQWNYYTDVRPANRDALILAATLDREFTLSASKNASKIRELDLALDIARQLKLIRRNAQPKSQKDVVKLESLQANMTEIFTNGKVCKNNTCISLEPDLNNLMSKSRDYDELVWAWQGWRDAVGPPVRKLFEQFVDLLNLGAREHGWGDYGHYMRSEYEIGNDLEPVLKKLWTDVKPLYKELHAYIRFQLKKKYKQISEGGPIPAHLLGNMWAQDWSTIYDMVKPFPKLQSLDITPSLIKQKYTAEKMFKLAQSFFVSIGLDPMPASFWSKSMIKKPGNKTVVCHASAWAFLKEDVRVSMCARLTQEDLIIMHHEMGHCEYFLSYKDQPYAYRNGANPGFHEAIGDTIALSVETPRHLKSVGLLYELPEGNGSNAKEQDTAKKEAAINFLLMQALRRVAPLPFTYLVDQWRWRVLAGKVSSSNYNSAWWKLRMHYQGVSPPVPRNESDFDPGAKFHIVANAPYISYFVSLILQFQFHKTLCGIAKHDGPLHDCDIYKSKEAGEKFKEMLSAGRSRPWPQTLYRLTGEREMTAEALLGYFKPLQNWLVTYRIKNKYSLGWKKIKAQSTATAEGVRKTLSSTKYAPSKSADHKAGSSDNGKKETKAGKGVSFQKTKVLDDGLNLKKPDLKTALEAMQPSKAKDEQPDAKSVIQSAKPMFVPNTVKDQIELGNQDQIKHN